MNRRQLFGTLMFAPWLAKSLGAAPDDIKLPAGPCKLPPGDWGTTLDKSAASQYVPQQTQQLLRPLFSKPAGSTALEAYRVIQARIAASEELQRHLLRQIWIHYYYCCGMDPVVGNIHDSHLFLPWHRGLVYFHERFLQCVLGDPQFRIPVFDWETSGAIPAPFPRGWPVSGGCVSSITDLHPVPMPVVQSWLATPDWASFAGDRGLSNGGAHLFVHAHLHAPMSRPESAAYDPVFFCHHANVDRLWLHWSKLHAHTYDPEPLYFYDGDDLVSVSVPDLMDESKLGYRYDDLSDTSLVTKRTSLQFQGNGVPFLSGDFSQRALALFLKALLANTNNLLDILTSKVGLSIPFRLKLAVPDFDRNQYYGIALQAEHNRQCLIGGFGFFGGTAPDQNELWVTGMVDSRLCQFFHTNGFHNIKLVYGEVGTDGDSVNVRGTFNVTGETTVEFLRPA